MRFEIKDLRFRLQKKKFKQKDKDKIDQRIINERKKEPSRSLIDFLKERKLKILNK